MTSSRLALAFLFAAGCSSTPQTDIADATVGPYTVHVFREGPMPAAGVSTDLVLKPLTGGKPDSVEGWVGLADEPASSKTQAVFDTGDGDFDTDLTCPDPMPAGAQIWFDLTTAGVVATMSVDIK
jgi:hypothetical protein